MRRVENKDLHLEDGTTLQWFKKDYKYFLNKTTLLYGRTQSGKSTIIDEISYLCKAYVSSVFVICQSSVTVESSDYFGKIPNHCIKSGVTKEWLMDFVKIQKNRAAIYKIANNIDNLKKVFDRIKDEDMEKAERLIIQEANKNINKISNSAILEYDEKKKQIDAVKEIKEKHLIKVYKDTVRRNKVTLESSRSLSEEERCCVMYLDFNPNMMLIWDDCASIFKKLTKDSPEIKEMFYNGRHYYITQIISSQDDKEIDSELRKNALVSIFTTAQAATANFTRASNSYSKHDKKRAEICCKRVFNSDPHSTGRNYKKLVYLQTDAIPDPFAYTIADLYDNFRLGCDALWQIDEKMKEKSGYKNDNSFFNKYVNV